MDDLARCEHYIEQELAHCDSCHALCQEMVWIATSEITELERRQQQLIAQLERLREARRLHLF
jgi:hypothetical protein